jgi:ATP-dependent exoDNAse (exonuclease V) alpha subunit
MLARCIRCVSSNLHSIPSVLSKAPNQLYNFSKAQSIQVDCVIADEAGQIALASLSLVLRCLLPTGRIIIAGDSEQLAPIFTGAYPRLKTAPLFGSVLDCVMSPQGDGPVIATGSQSQGESQDDGEHTVIQLTENFR